MGTVFVDNLEPQSGTSLTLGASGDTISLGSGVSGSGLGKFETQLLHVRDEKSNGTNGGSAQNTSFTVRDLNTILTNEITGASLSSNRITLPSGTFYVHASAPAYETNMHRVFLYNHSDSSNILFGGNATADSGSGSHSEVVGRFTLSASKNIELRHYTTNAGGVDALGRRVSQGDNEIFAQVLIWKVA